MTQNIIPEFLLEGLNEPQREAVFFKDGALLVLAGPGSGKTRVVTHRIAALLYQGVGASQIAALTFTNKAADEMKNRLSNLAPNRHVWIGTFHKFCASLLRRYIKMVGLKENFTIYDSSESLTLLKSVTERMNQAAFPPGINVQRIFDAISWAKNNLVTADKYVATERSLPGKLVEEIYPEYQAELCRANAVDFDDLLLHVAILLQENSEVRKILDNRFRYILVDEYQDTNTVQYYIVKALSVDHRNLAVTGDPDQSIYGWRGANIKNILDFEKDFPDTKIIRLEQNYRSTPQILAAADSLIENNLYRKKKQLIAENPAGSPVRLVRCTDQREEAECIAEEIETEIHNGKYQPNDYAIFYRMNALSRNLEHALRSRKIPFRLVRGLEFFNRKEIKDILAYLRVVYNPSDTVSLTRIINEPARGIGKTTLKKMSGLANEHGVTTMDIARNIHSVTGIVSKTKKSVTEFVEMIDRAADASAREYPVESLIRIVLEESGYRKQFLNSESEEDLERLENIDELLTVAREFDTRNNVNITENQLLAPTSSLEEFLEQAALVNDVDSMDNDTDRVSLMTLHAAKGLEFPVVYIVAVEEGILPHDRSAYDVMQLEEERRLFFVGITRAEKELRLSRVDRRDFRGMFGVTAIFSRFLTELPNDANMVKYDSPDEFLNSIDYGDGIRLVLEPVVNEDYKMEISEINSDDDKNQIEFDVNRNHIKKKKETNEQERGKNANKEKYSNEMEYEEGVDEVWEDIDVEYEADAEYDAETGEIIQLSRKKVTKTKKKPRSDSTFSIITRADLLRQQQEQE